MPDFTFDGPYTYRYPELRHSDHTPVGEVQPGDIRDLAAAPDHMWRETTDEDRAALEAIAAARQQAADEERFARLVRQLSGMGLSPAALEQLVKAGAADGLPVAEGLVAGGMRAVRQASEQAAAVAANLPAAKATRPKPSPRSGDQTGTDAGKTGSEGASDA